MGERLAAVAFGERLAVEALAVLFAAPFAPLALLAGAAVLPAAFLGERGAAVLAAGVEADFLGDLVAFFAVEVLAAFFCVAISYGS
ncbi:MAG: hypothetical protein KDA55_18420 [Planctomycetales bacterium]|nr:hypothetical protein [Planctomycetales bacterium]MCA9210343.1 hypothetical protein [Planctomycetales bacterium]